MAQALPLILAASGVGAVIWQLGAGFSRISGRIENLSSEVKGFMEHNREDHVKIFNGLRDHGEQIARFEMRHEIEDQRQDG